MIEHQLMEGNVIEILDMNTADGAEEEGLFLIAIANKRCQCRSKRYPSREIRSNQNIHATDYIPPHHWSRRS